VTGPSIHQLAVRAEADRLAGVYLRIKLLAQSRRIECLQGCEAAMHEGLETEASWSLVWEATGGR
jgi:hypothetical protein